MIQKPKEEGVQQQLNLRVKDGDQFYSNEASINFNPNEFSLDFKCLTHLHDVGEHRSLLLKHNIVIMTPFHLKSFANILSKAVVDYEKRFGKIEKSEAVKKAEKLVKKENKKTEQENKEGELYFG
jgi:hypothetical protein